MLALDWRSRIAIALVTALALAVAQRREGQGGPRWFAPGHPLVRLGRISYSLFLIHFPVLLLVNGVASQFAPMTPWGDAAALLGTFALSIGAAAILYRWVESRPATWPVVLVLFAALLASGTLVGLG
jgi:peptidoglycan/LPS O-acetylase OafA/YrhL